MNEQPPTAVPSTHFGATYFGVGREFSTSSTVIGALDPQSAKST